MADGHEMAERWRGAMGEAKASTRDQGGGAIWGMGVGWWGCYKRKEGGSVSYPLSVVGNLIGCCLVYAIFCGVLFDNFNRFAAELDDDDAFFGDVEGGVGFANSEGTSKYVVNVSVVVECSVDGDVFAVDRN